MLFLCGSLLVTAPGSQVCSGKEAPAWGPLTAFGAEPKCVSKADSLAFLGNQQKVTWIAVSASPHRSGVIQGKAFQQSFHMWRPLLVLVFSTQEECVCLTDCWCDRAIQEHDNT